MAIVLETAEHRYTKEEVQASREDLITLRNAALEQTNFDYAVSLSHTIAMLACVIEQMDED